jgi:protoporphyrin/coproporphyrin ferrochelatase
MSKDAALILNFGGPRSLDEVGPFLEHLFMDPAILPFPGPLRRWLARSISRRRTPMVQAQYARIGGRSPLVDDTFALLDALRPLVPAEVGLYTAMAYTPPWIGETLARMLEDGVERAVCVALFPQYSRATSGSVFATVAEELARRGGRMDLTFVPAWHDHPGYLEALCERVRAGLGKMPEAGAGAHLLVSAHGLPVSFIRKGDPYQRQVQENVRLLVQRLGWEGPYSLAYQSRVGPVRWLGPSTDEEIEHLHAHGVRRLFVVPVSFVSDHIETLYEIDLLYGDRARELGFEAFERMEALGLHPSFVGCLADLVHRGLGGRYRRTCVRCLMPKGEEHFRAKKCPDCLFEIPAFQRT